MLQNPRKRQHTSGRKHASSTIQSAKPRCRLELETLEDRVTPSVGLDFAAGGDSLGASSSIAVTTDSAGDIFFGGKFSDNLALGNVVLTAQSSSTNPDDGFVAERTSAGVFSWAHDIGGANSTAAAEVTGVALNAAGDVFVTGTFHGTVNFDPNASNDTLTSSDGGADDTAFVMELSPSGAFARVATQGMGGAGCEAHANGIAVSASGYVYTVGYFSGVNLQFDPASAFDDLLTSSNSGSDSNTYVSVLTPSLNFSSLAQIGSGGQTDGIAIALNATNGEIYTTGTFKGTNVQFDPNGNTHSLTSAPSGAATNAFISVLAPNGPTMTYQNVFDLGYGGYAQTNSIAIDGAGNVYTTGWFQGTNQGFDPLNQSNALLTSSNNGKQSNAFVSKLSPTGVFGYVDVLGSGGDALGTRIAVDASGDVYVSGDFNGLNEQYDPNSSNHPLSSSNGGQDGNVFISSLNPQGQFNYVAQLGQGGNAFSRGLALVSGEPVVVGYFEGTNVNFNPDGQTSLSSLNTSTDAYFVAQLTQLLPMPIGPATMPGASTGVGYDQFVTPTNGTAPYTFTVSSGALPPGLTLNASTGEISGTPKSAGTYAVTIAVVDDSGSSTSQRYSITVASEFATPAYEYTYWSYIYAYDAYVTGTGSYTAFYDEYYAFVYSQIADQYASAGNTAVSEYYAYYAYYYGYLGQYYAYLDYTQSGGQSVYSYYAYYYGYYGETYSYYTAIGQ